MMKSLNGEDDVCLSGNIPPGTIKEDPPEVIMKRLKKHAAENRKYFEGVDIVKVLRRMRNEAKW